MTLSKIQFGNTGRRNLIINGAMNISQRATSTTGVGASAAYFSCDRFKFGQNSRDQAVFTIAQVSDAPSGFLKSFKITTTTPESAIDASDLFWIEQKIEGQNITHLKNGSSDAKPVTLSFYVKSSITGTFGLTLWKPENTVRLINSTYTINSANTWEFKTVTFAGDTSGGGINNDNSEALSVVWHLASGSDYDSVNSTSWANYSTTNWAGGHAQDGVVTTSNATWQLAGVQLEVGSTATDFEHLSYAEDLALCQRYYYKRDVTIYNVVALGHGLGDRGGYLLHTPVSMRLKPSVSQGSNIQCWYNNGGSVTAQDNLAPGYMNSADTDFNQVYIRADANSNISGNTYPLGLTSYHGSGTANSYIALDSEL